MNRFLLYLDKKQVLIIIPFSFVMLCALHHLHVLFSQRIFSYLIAQVLASAKEFVSKDQLVGLLVSLNMVNASLISSIQHPSSSTRHSPGHRRRQPLLCPVSAQLVHKIINK
jgi:hypothetical protein